MGYGVGTNSTHLVVDVNAMREAEVDNRTPKIDLAISSPLSGFRSSSSWRENRAKVAGVST